MVLELASVGVLDTVVAGPAFAPVDAVPVLFTACRPGRNGRARRPTPGMLVAVGDRVRIAAPPSSRTCLHWGDAVGIEVGYSEATRAAGFEGVRLAARVDRVEADVRGLVVWAREDAGTAPWGELLAWVRGLAA